MALLGPFVDLGEHPRVSAEALVQKARAADVDRLLVACCQGAEPFQAAAGPRLSFTEIAAVDHTARCFPSGADPAEANGKALRYLRGELRAAQQRKPVREAHLQAGKRVVLVTDLPAGLALAESLSATLSVTPVAPAEMELPPDFPARRVQRGRLAGVQGRLGAFVTRIAAGAGAGRELASDQVLLVLREPPPVKPRTGLHLFVDPDASALAAIPRLLHELAGDFMKPVSVSYDPALCAGGAAAQQACGLCLPACPYQAIARAADNPVRIRVDELACEGCGACTAACPTSALTFNEPNAGEVLGRLAGQLGPAAGAPRGPLGVVFHCSRHGRAALDSAGGNLLAGGHLLPVEVPCLRHVSDALLLAALRMGAAGVALLGCETCPHGERPLLELNLEIAGRVARAAGLGAGRLHLITVRDRTVRDRTVGAGSPQDGTAAPEAALERLAAFAADLVPSPLRHDADRYQPAGNRELVADALGAFLAQGSPHAAPLPLPRGAPYARAEVRAEGCTLCRSCANVCPTHAFRFDEAEQTLEFKHIACVACGLCEAVCPEQVIALRRELSLTPEALDYRVLVRDEMVRCTRCDKPFVNKRALEAVQARVRKAPALAGVFDGERSGLLRMCPDCRAISAMLSVREGWRP
jgi:ferredoxin